MGGSQPIDRTSPDLTELAVAQRLMVWAILTWFVGFLPPAMFVTIPFQLYCIYRLAAALRLDRAIMIVAMLLIFVPVLCILPLLAMYWKAVTVLRAGGSRVGC